MASSKTKRNVGSRRTTNGAEPLAARLTADAQKLLSANREVAAKAVDKFRKDVEKRARRAIRDVERKLLKQMHIATDEQLRRLEARVARLERRDEA